MKFRNLSSLKEGEDFPQNLQQYLCESSQKIFNSYTTYLRKVLK